MPPGPDRANRRRAYCGVVVPVPPVVPPIDPVVEVPPIVPVEPVPPIVPVVEPVPVPVVPLIEPPVVVPVPMVPPIDPSVEPPIEPVAGVVVLVEFCTPVVLPCVPARLLRPRLDERVCVVVVLVLAEESVGEVVVCPPIDPEVPPIVEPPVVVVWA